MLLIRCLAKLIIKYNLLRRRSIRNNPHFRLITEYFSYVIFKALARSRSRLLPDVIWATATLIQSNNRFNTKGGGSQQWIIYQSINRLIGNILSGDSTIGNTEAERACVVCWLSIAISFISIGLWMKELLSIYWTSCCSSSILLIYLKNG